MKERALIFVGAAGRNSLKLCALARALMPHLIEELRDHGLVAGRTAALCRLA